MTRRVRTTISLKPEVLEVYRQMAEASGSSLSRVIGDWLDGTLDGAMLINQKVAEAKGMPSLFLSGLLDLVEVQKIEVEQLEKLFRNADYPPSSNTGLKSGDKKE